MRTGMHKAGPGWGTTFNPWAPRGKTKPASSAALTAATKRCSPHGPFWGAICVQGHGYAMYCVPLDGTKALPNRIVLNNSASPGVGVGGGANPPPLHPEFHRGGNTKCYKRK